MATPEERHVEVITAIGHLNTKVGKMDTTINLVIKPAVEQTWTNKDCIAKLKTKQSLVTWIGSTVGAGFIYTVIRQYLTKHPPV